MPCVSPLGYPAAKRALREGLMRKGVKADSRKPLGEIFFEKDLSSPIENCGEHEAAMELVRWAPSAVNKQPWRVIRDGNRYHFYEKHDKGFLSDAVGDMQKIDLGIALYHFVGGLADAGRSAGVSIAAPAIEVPADMEYIATVTVE